MLSYAGRRWRGWSAIFATTLLGTGVSLLAPLPLKVLVDNVLGPHPVPAVLSWLPGAGTHHGLLVWVVIAEILVFSAASAVDVASTFLWTIVGQGMVFELTRDVFARVQRRSLRAHLRSPVGDTIERVAGDTWSVHTVMDELIFTPLHSVVTIVAVALVLWNLDSGLTLIAFAVAPLMVLTPILLGKRIRTLGEEQRRVQGRIHSHVQQTLAGIPVVQAFGQETRQHRVFQQLANTAVRLQTRGAVLGGVGGLSSGLVTTLGTGIVLLVGGQAVLHHHLTIGDLLVFASYVGILQGQIAGLTGIYSTLQGARPSIDRVVEVLDAPADVEDRRGAVVLGGVRGEVAVEGVSFGYEVGRPVLRGVSFSAGPGEVVAVVGPTGAGKTTLVGLLPRFFDPDEGRVLLDGRDVRELRLRQVRDSVSLVLQESFLFPFSIAENIAYGRPGASREEVVEAARAANAHEFVVRLPDGYDTVVGERGATLSGGERQRVAIARALLKDAPVLILDEPTSALDAETEGSLLQALERLMVGRTTVIIAHRLSTIRRADQILVLREGRIVERGSHQELIDQGGHYARMHDIQHGTQTI
ncbi:MAG: ATP-binding cassette, subfamily bacterial [Solirubrobacteraceae bacterium]|nr:ATP-binding cassette, subfamily bacterial [Solirubrobacteraceae bacterium]